MRTLTIVLTLFLSGCSEITQHHFEVSPEKSYTLSRTVTSDIWNREPGIEVYHFSNNEERTFSVGLMEFPINIPYQAKVKSVWLEYEYELLVTGERNERLIARACNEMLCWNQCQNGNYNMTVNSIGHEYGFVSDTGRTHMNHLAMESLQRTIRRAEGWWAIALLWEDPEEDYEERARLTQIRLKVDYEVESYYE